jgi:hypothetical protein
MKINMDRAGPKGPKRGCTQRTSKELNTFKDPQKNGFKGLKKGVEPKDKKKTLYFSTHRYFQGVANFNRNN